jgi:hypothetical protein
MSIAKNLGRQEDRQYGRSGARRGRLEDGAFLFPDGSGGSFSRNESYRDSEGDLRIHTVFVSNSVTG